MPLTSRPPDVLQLVLVRHAQTVANVEGRWVGWGDTELTALGRLQIAAVAQRLKAEVRGPVVLYTSPLARARETAAAIGRALGVPPVSRSDLQEVNFGSLDGITLEEMERDYPALFARWQDKGDSTFTWPGGDRRSDFFHRVAAACDDILSRHDEGTVIVVGHGGTLRAFLAHLLPDQLGQWWGYSLDNCGVTRLLVERKVRLVVLNDTTHLPNSA